MQKIITYDIVHPEYFEVLPDLEFHPLRRLVDLPGECVPHDKETAVSPADQSTDLLHGNVMCIRCDIDLFIKILIHFLIGAFQAVQDLDAMVVDRAADPASVDLVQMPQGEHRQFPDSLFQKMHSRQPADFFTVDQDPVRMFEWQFRIGVENEIDLTGLVFMSG